MKKTLLFLFLFLVCTANIYSQDDDYFDAPFGGGIGYTGGWIIPNVDVFNSQIKSLGIPEFSTNGFYTSGVSGYLYLGFLKQFRIGGMNFGGSMSRNIILSGINKEAIYSQNGGGITVEYTLPYFRKIAISIGSTIGRGSLELELFQNKGAINFNDIFNNLTLGTSSNINKSIQNKYWFIIPTLNIDYPLSRFITARIGVGYNITFGSNWTVDNGVNISGVPSSIDGNAFFIQAGIMMGFFSF